MTPLQGFITYCFAVLPAASITYPIIFIYIRILMVIFSLIISILNISASGNIWHVITRSANRSICTKTKRKLKCIVSSVNFKTLYYDILTGFHLRQTMNLVMCSTWIGLSHFLVTVALPVFNVDINGSARYGLLENIFNTSLFQISYWYNNWWILFCAWYLWNLFHAAVL